MIIIPVNADLHMFFFQINELDTPQHIHMN